MTSPTAVGSIGLGSSLAGGIMKGQAASEKGEALQRMYGYQAGMAQINAQIDRQNADYAIMAGEKNAQKYGLKAGQTAGAIKAGQGASGLDVNSGSAVDVQKSQQHITQMDTDQIRANAAKTAYDFNVQATSDENQAGLYQMAGDNAKRAGDIEALGSYVGTAESVSSKWLQGRQQGLWG